MLKQKASQSEVNEICQILERQGEEINISTVKHCLGKGLHSTLVTQINLYQQDKQKAFLIAKNETEPTSIKIDNIDTKNNLSAKLTNFFNKKGIDQSDTFALETRAIIQEYIDASILEYTDSVRKENHKLQVKYDQLDTQLLHYKQRVQQLLEERRRLEDHMLLAKQAKPGEIDKIRSCDKPVDEKQKSTHLRQLGQLQGDDKAAFDQAQNMIVLKLYGFNSSTIKAVKNKKQTFKVHYNYATKLYEVTNYKSDILRFLIQHGFDVSQELAEHLNIIKNDGVSYQL